MTSSKYNQVKKIVIAAGILSLPMIGSAQEIKYNSSKDTVIVKSKEKLSDLSKYNTSSNPFIYKIPTNECDNVFNPKVEGIYKKAEAAKWRAEYNNWKKQSRETILSKDKKINELEQKLKNVSKDTIITKENSTNIYNVEIDKSNNTINNFYGKKDFSTKNKSSIDFRTLLEGNASVDGKSYGALISEQIRLGKNKESSSWIGPYIEANFGKIEEKSSTDVYNKTLLDAEFDMHAISRGVRESSIESSSPFGAGLMFSVDASKNVRFNLNAGIVNENRKTSSIKETGIDEITQAGSVIDSKPYAFDIASNESSSEYIPKFGASIHFSPSKKSGFYLGAGVSKSKESEVNFNAKIGLKFGGNKK